MKRILFMHHVSSIGGGSFCLLNLIKELDKAIWCPVVALKSRGPLEKELEKLNVDVIFFNEMTTIPYNKHFFTIDSISKYYFAKKSRPSFKRLLEKNHIDVVYLNNMMLYNYLQPAKECGLKTVIHIREHWPLNEHKYQLGWARRAVNLYADKLIAINNYSASMFPDKECNIVYDWIDMDIRYAPFDMNGVFKEDCTNKKIILYTGGLQMIKGPDYIITSFSEGIKDENCRLLVLGIDSIPRLGGLRHIIKRFLSFWGYNYSIKRMVDCLRTDKRIICIPYNYNIASIIQQSSCFVSYFRMPHANLSLAENIILTTPCIAADNEEAREYSGNGEYALLVKPNTPKLFLESLQNFLLNIDSWKEKAILGSVFIRDQFDRKMNADKFNMTLSSLQ